jgi:DNA-binding CsgD family transcriptional regulator
MMKELTDRQRTALWLRAQGLTADAIGKRLSPPCRASGAQNLLHKAMKTLDAADSSNAVFRAMATGIIGPYLDCGTRKAYERHLRRDEVTCVACRVGNNRGWKNVRPRQKLPLTPTHRRVLTAIESGAGTSSEIGRALGITDARVRHLLADLYGRLGIDTVLHGPDGAKKEALRVAQERGLLNGSPDPVPLPVLTELQRRVLVMAQADEPLVIIGVRLGMTKRVVASHLSRIYRRLGVPSREQQIDARRDRRKAAFDIALERNLL